jgi:hypothetical protein
MPEQNRRSLRTCTNLSERRCYSSMEGELCGTGLFEQSFPSSSCAESFAGGCQNDGCMGVLQVWAERTRASVSAYGYPAVLNRPKRREIPTKMRIALAT